MRDLAPDTGIAVDVLYQAYRDRFVGGLEDFRRMTVGWDLALMMIDGEVAGVAARRGGDIHIGVLPVWRSKWATQAYIQQILSWAAESGPVTTGVMAGNDAGRRLVEGVGFVQQQVTEKGVRYALPR